MRSAVDGFTNVATHIIFVAKLENFARKISVFFQLDVTLLSFCNIKPGIFCDGGEAKQRKNLVDAHGFSVELMWDFAQILR